MTARHANDWDNRYDAARYFYGTEPNVFVAGELARLTPGRGLFLAEGEGRNAVHAAGLGFEAVAVDSSSVGRRKALALAARRGVAIEYVLEDVVGGSWAGETWDVIVLCFAHFPPEQAARVHADCAAALRPGGTLILQSFSRAQFGRKSGGPPRLDWLHDPAELKEQFPGLELTLAEREVELAEGTGHRGAAMVVELVGRRPQD